MFEIEIHNNYAHFYNALQWCLDENIEFKTGDNMLKDIKSNWMLNLYKDEWTEFLYKNSNVIFENANTDTGLIDASSIFIFEKESDAMMFKLVWG